MKKKYPAILIIISLILFVVDIAPPALLLLIIGISLLRKEASKEQERQREIERKEINMIRKANEILLHLIQDEHREEGDR